MTAIVLVFFAVDTLRNAPETFAAIIGIAALSDRPRPRLEAPTRSHSSAPGLLDQHSPADPDAERLTSRVGARTAIAACAGRRESLEAGDT